MLKFGNPAIQMQCLVAESIMMLRSGKSSLSKEHIRIGRREADMEEESPRRIMREGRPARTMMMSSPVSPVRSRSPATRGRSR